MDKYILMDSRRKKLLFQSQHRGIKEIDIFLGSFAEKYIRKMSDTDLSLFDTLLNEKDLDLYNWITGQTTIPAHLDHNLIEKIRKFNSTK